MPNPQSTTLTITKDEMCLMLQETDRPTMMGQHRFQEITVMRGQHPALYEWDMGPREMYQRRDLIIPLGVVTDRDGEGYAYGTLARHLIHRYKPDIRVGDAMDIADEKRSEMLREDLMLPDMNWAQGWVDHEAEKAQWRANRSTFGPLGSIVRN